MATPDTPEGSMYYFQDDAGSPVRAAVMAEIDADRATRETEREIEAVQRAASYATYIRDIATNEIRAVVQQLRNPRGPVSLLGALTLRDGQSVTELSHRMGAAIEADSDIEERLAVLSSVGIVSAIDDYGISRYSINDRSQELV